MKSVLSNLLIISVLAMTVADSTFAAPPPRDEYSLQAKLKGSMRIARLGNKRISIAISQNTDEGRVSLATQLTKAFNLDRRLRHVEILIHEDSCFFESEMVFYCDFPKSVESKILLKQPRVVQHEFNNIKDDIRLYFWMNEIQEKSVQFGNFPTSPIFRTELTGELNLYLTIKAAGLEKLVTTGIRDEIYKPSFY